MRAVYASSGVDLQEVKKLGFNTVIGSFTKLELDMMERLNMRCIYHGYGLQHPAIYAYYVYDEPDFNKVSLADQEKEIARYRSFTYKPLAIACVEQTKRECSPNFDLYMMDIYYYTGLGKYEKLINYVNIAVSVAVLKVLYRGKKIIPIMGLYDDLTEFRQTPECLPFAKKFKSYFKTPDHAIFIWRGDGVRYWGIMDRPEYQEYATELNLRKRVVCGDFMLFVLKMLAKVIVAVRSLISDNLISWFNNKLPKNMRMKL